MGGEGVYGIASGGGRLDRRALSDNRTFYQVELRAKIIPVGAALLIWMGGVSPAWIILAAIAGGLVYGLNKKG